MSDDGMHENNAGGRHRRPLAQPILCGLEGLRARAKLSDAIGYDARDVSRTVRGKSRETDREHLR
ncbi:MAG: hypothetical protein VX216_06215 [Candidatus Thermoplasmatota archaeon]|nr:hypothetical protein [Candidatus Thermoplasmatota archaeon]